MANPNFQGSFTTLVGIPVSGISNAADVNTSNELLVSDQYSAGGTLNSTGQVSIGTSATPIIAANTRQGVKVTNPSSTVTVYIGGPSVSTSNGDFLLPSSATTIPTVSALYGVVATGSQTISFMELT